MFKPTNAQITEKLKEFGLPVIYGPKEERGLDQDFVDNYHFFSYAPIRISLEDMCTWKQEIEIYYLSMDQADLREHEIFETLKEIKLDVREILYDRVYASDKEAYVDIVIFKCYRRSNLVGR